MSINLAEIRQIATNARQEQVDQALVRARPYLELAEKRVREAAKEGHFSTQALSDEELREEKVVETVIKHFEDAGFTTQVRFVSLNYLTFSRSARFLEVSWA